MKEKTQDTAFGALRILPRVDFFMFQNLGGQQGKKPSKDCNYNMTHYCKDKQQLCLAILQPHMFALDLLKAREKQRRHLRDKETKRQKNMSFNSLPHSPQEHNTPHLKAFSKKSNHYSHSRVNPCSPFEQPN